MGFAIFVLISEDNSFNSCNSGSMLKRREKSGKSSGGLHCITVDQAHWKCTSYMAQKQVVWCQEGQKQGSAGMLKSHSSCIFGI